MDKDNISVSLPDDLLDILDKYSTTYGESITFLAIAAVEHFTRIPEEQRKAVIRGTAIRRRGGK
jgi:metal-responsive CopG/Arc/MetJ family transcriptional regulator